MGKKEVALPVVLAGGGKMPRVPSKKAWQQGRPDWKGPRQHEWRKARLPAYPDCGRLNIGYRILQTQSLLRCAVVMFKDGSKGRKPWS